MQLNEMDQLALDFNKKVREYFGDKVGNFVILDVLNVPGHMEFRVEFDIYKYADISVTYENGGISASILLSKYPKTLNVRADYKTANFDEFFEKMKKEIELRIPDKYLEAKGWK